MATIVSTLGRAGVRIRTVGREDETHEAVVARHAAEVDRVEREFARKRHAPGQSFRKRNEDVKGA